MKNMIRVSLPIFETIDEARISLIKKYGQHEFVITEDPVDVHYFDVVCIKDNRYWEYKYAKKITNIVGGI